MVALADHPPWKIIMLDGEVRSDGTGSGVLDKLRTLLLEGIQEPASQIRLDFSRCQEVDAGTLGVLAAFSCTLRQTKSDAIVEVVSANPEIRQTLRIFQLDHMIHIPLENGKDREGV